MTKILCDSINNDVTSTEEKNNYAGQRFSAAPDRNDGTNIIEKQITKEPKGIFQTMGEFRKPLENYVYNMEIRQKIREITGKIKGHKKYIHFVATDIIDNHTCVVCLLQSKNQIVLKRGEYWAYVYDIENEKLSGFKEVCIIKSWNGQYVLKK